MQKKLKNKFNRMRSRVQRKVKYLGQNPTTKIKEIFDADYYKSQLNYDYEVIDLIDHFYRVGWKDRKNPHPLLV